MDTSTLIDRNEGSNSWSASTHAAIRVLFGLVLGRNLIQHTDSLSVCLQRKSLSAAEVQTMAAMTIRTLKTMTADDTFALFRKYVTTLAEHNLVNAPVLPRRLPERYFMKHRTPNVYFEAIDKLTISITDCFDEHYHNIYMNCESILMKITIGEDAKSEFDTVTEFYGSDFMSAALQGHLQIFGSNSSMSYLKLRTTSICQMC